jgi:hypothetical protein
MTLILICEFEPIIGHAGCDKNTHTLYVAILRHYNDKINIRISAQQGAFHHHYF